MQPGKANLSLQYINPNLVILDSSALGHFLKNHNFFTTFHQSPSILCTTNGAPLKVEGFCKAVIPLEKNILKIPQAQLVPDLSNSLISMTPYLKSGYSISPSKDGFVCIKGEDKLLSGIFVDNILALNLSHPHAATF